MSRRLGDRLFSGIQPSGRLHLGNYLGAIQNWVALSKMYEKPLFCLVDLHSLTSLSRTEPLSQVRDRLQANNFELAATLLACGLDPADCVIYRQSQVVYHAHLAWILSCRTRTSSLGLMTQYKTKTEADQLESNCGLFTYPVLMAADIMLVRNPVPRTRMEMTCRFSSKRKSFLLAKINDST